MQRFIAGLARTRGFVPGFLTLVLGSAYASIVLYNYGWSDDFASLYAVHSEASLAGMQSFYDVQGRPLGGVIVQAAFRLAGSMEGLRGVRVAQLGLVLVCGLILAAEFRRVVPAWVGLGAVSLILLSPAFAVFAAWPSSGLLNLPAALLALVGGRCWLRTFERPGPRDAGFWRRAVAAGALALAALATYQPSACFFLLPAAIRLLDGDPPRARAGSTWTACGFAAICGVYFAAFRLIQPWLAGAHTSVATRAEFVTDIPARLRFFQTYALGRSYESWAVFFGSTPGEAVAGAGAALTLLFLVRLVQAQIGLAARLHALLIVIVLFGLASAPLLIVKDSYAPYRTLAVLYSFAAVGVTGGIWTLWRWLPAEAATLRGAVATFWFGLLVANFLSAGYVVTEGFVLRSVRETNIYRRFVHHRLSSYPTEVILILPDPQKFPRISRIYPDNEFGTASSFVDWTFPGLFCSLIRDELRDVLPSRAAARGWQTLFDEVRPDGSTLFAPGLLVIDTGQALARTRLEGELPRSGPVIQDAFFGEVQPLTPFWRLSRWFGLYNVASPGLIVHRDLGKLELAGHGGGDCWFRHDALGWFWTGPASFPLVYSAERRRWLRYVRGTEHLAVFLDADAPGHAPVPVR